MCPLRYFRHEPKMKIILDPKWQVQSNAATHLLDLKGFNSTNSRWLCFLSIARPILISFTTIVRKMYSNCHLIFPHQHSCTKVKFLLELGDADLDVHKTVIVCGLHLPNDVGHPLKTTLGPSNP